MRTSIEIDDKLLREAMKSANLRSKRATIEEGLRVLVRHSKQVAAIRSLRGTVDWQGDLDAWRRHE
jgi:Arc/MetJ family transcription regulator